MSRTILAGLALAAAAHGLARADAPAPAAPAAAPARAKVAVIAGVAVNLEPARVDALAQDLATALSTELDVDAVGGLDVRRALPADGIPADCVTTPACVADVARRTNATQLLFVVMVDSGAGGSIQIDATWIDPATGATAAPPAIDVTSVAEARARFAAAAHSLLPNAPIRPRPKHLVDVNVHSDQGTPRHLTTPALITAGVTIAGLGVGVGFGLATRSKYHHCDDSPATCSSNDRSTIRTVGRVADVGYLVSIGGAVATALIYATSGEGPHVIVTPNQEGGASVSAFGSF